MTDVKIIEWAKKCGWDNPATNMAPLYEFAKLVAQHEREACAKIVELNADACRSDNVAQMILYSNAAAIRARGEA